MDAKKINQKQADIAKDVYKKDVKKWAKDISRGEGAEAMTFNAYLGDHCVQLVSIRVYRTKSFSWRNFKFIVLYHEIGHTEIAKRIVKEENGKLPENPERGDVNKARAQSEKRDNKLQEDFHERYGRDSLTTADKMMEKGLSPQNEDDVKEFMNDAIDETFSAEK